MNFRFLAVFGLTLAFTSLTFGSSGGSSCFPTLASVATTIANNTGITAAQKKTLQNDMMNFKFNVALTLAKQLHNSGKLTTPQFELINTLFSILAPSQATANALKALWNNCTASELTTIQNDLSSGNDAPVESMLFGKIEAMPSGDQISILKYYTLITNACNSTVQNMATAALAG